jgi:hypothetical protein
MDDEFVGQERLHRRVRPRRRRSRRDLTQTVPSSSTLTTGLNACWPRRGGSSTSCSRSLPAWMRARPLPSHPRPQDDLRPHGARGEIVAYVRRMRASAADSTGRPGLVQRHRIVVVDRDSCFPRRRRNRVAPGTTARRRRPGARARLLHRHRGRRRRDLAGRLAQRQSLPVPLRLDPDRDPGRRRHRGVLGVAGLITLALLYRALCAVVLDEEEARVAGVPVGASTS